MKCFQCVLTLDAFCYVSAAANVAREGPHFIRVGDTTVEYPTVGAVCSAQPILHLEDFACGERPGIGIEAAS